MNHRPLMGRKDLSFSTSFDSNKSILDIHLQAMIKHSIHIHLLWKMITKISKYVNGDWIKCEDCLVVLGPAQFPSW